MAELVWVLDPSRPAIDLDSLTTRITTRTAAEQPLLFAPTVLALAAGIGPELSRRIIGASPAFVQHETSGRFRLADRFDPAAPLPLPAELVLTPEEADAVGKATRDIAAVLAPYRASSVIVAAAAGALDRQADAVEVLARLTALDLGDPALVQELLGSAPPTALRRVVAALAHLAVVLRGWDAAALGLLWHRPDIAGFSVGSAPDWETFDRLHSLRTFFGVRDEAVARARRATVAGYSTTAGLAGVSDDDLRVAFASSSAQVRAADGTIGLRLVAADAITTVGTWVRTAES